MLLPPATVNVSLLLSAAVIVDCPDTATFLNIFCEEPLSAFVKVTVP